MIYSGALQSQAWQASRQDLVPTGSSERSRYHNINFLLGVPIMCDILPGLLSIWAVYAKFVWAHECGLPVWAPLKSMCKPGQIPYITQTGLGPGRLGLHTQIPHGPRLGSLSGIWPWTWSYRVICQLYGIWLGLLQDLTGARPGQPRLPVRPVWDMPGQMWTRFAHSCPYKSQANLLLIPWADPGLAHSAQSCPYDSRLVSGRARFLGSLSQLLKCVIIYSLFCCTVSCFFTGVVHEFNIQDYKIYKIFITPIYGINTYTVAPITWTRIHVRVPLLF